MRKILIVATLLVATFSSLSMYRNTALDLLNEHDYALMKGDFADGPTLSGPLSGDSSWASYNQWLCFPTQNINISCMEAEYGQIRRVPAIHVIEDLHYYEFSMDPDLGPDCDKIMKRWKTLLEDEGAFCVYAAPLQELDLSAYDTDAESGSLWIVNQLKTIKGYWKSSEHENWLNDENDSMEDEARE